MYSSRSYSWASIIPFVPPLSSFAPYFDLRLVRCLEHANRMLQETAKIRCWLYPALMMIVETGVDGLVSRRFFSQWPLALRSFSFYLPCTMLFSCVVVRSLGVFVACELWFAKLCTDFLLLVDGGVRLFVFFDFDSMRPCTPISEICCIYFGTRSTIHARQNCSRSRAAPSFCQHHR